ncbi:MAG: N-acetylmuramoyl-L-alanine amidase [Alphaproteobacteria bacterium]|nr:MAG: N-acetylmuramoyl-L-alanine amidase [Alphaproteobacteria bacterium]
MLLFRILLIFFIFTNINILFSIDYKLKNIRFSDNHQSKSLRIVLDLTHKAPYTVFSLNNNPRLVIDLESKSEIKKFKNESIYIKNIRTRKTEQNVMRIVFDLKSNFYIDKHFYLKKNEKNIYRLVIDLKLNNKSSVEYKEKKPRKESKFIITIDAGHGGIDPGAINLGKKEKNITLIAAKELKNILEKKNFKVFLTRKDDTFISLRNRRNIAKKNNSDLFISLHVDSLKKKTTRGTSIYTLSEKASDSITARLAERENKVDLIAGVNLQDVDNEVASILLDLNRRETKNSSSLFAESYVNIVRKNGHRLLRRPHRHAGFAVLKSTDIPSVLIELGFLSNVNDVKLLTKKKTRLRLLVSLAEAIELFAKKRRNFN